MKTLTHSAVSWPNLRIYYITSKPLYFWRRFHYVCVCLCVCPSGPWVLLSYHTLSLMTPLWFPLDSALQHDNLLFAKARRIT